MANLLKPTVDHMVFRQDHMPASGRFRRDHPVLVDEMPRGAALHFIPASFAALVPVLAVMALIVAIGYVAVTLIELAGLEFRHALKPVSGMNEFLNADALGRTLRAQTLSFARASLRLPG
jgi:hypothetical protein